MLTREAADGFLADLDRYVRGPGKGEPDDDDDMTGGGEPLPSSGDEPGEAPQDPETAKEMILAELREQLDWDGQSGDPNESLAALEDALADMFDADVEILWDGEARLTLRVEGEKPVPLTVEFLGGLLEELAKSGTGTADDDGEDDDDTDDGQRAHEAWRRGRKFDESKVNRDPGGEDGGRFVKKGTTAAGAVAGAAKTGGGSGGGGSAGGNQGPQPSKLAARAEGRAGPRATAKAVSGALSAGTGQRVKVSGNKDGSFNVGRKKQKMSGAKVALIMIASWLAFGLASGFIAATLGIPLGLLAGATAVALIAELVALIKGK